MRSIRVRSELAASERLSHSQSSQRQSRARRRRPSYLPSLVKPTADVRALWKLERVVACRAKSRHQ